MRRIIIEDLCSELDRAAMRGIIGGDRKNRPSYNSVGGKNTAIRRPLRQNYTTTVHLGDNPSKLAETIGEGFMQGAVGGSVEFM